jgi:hypothetical protein
MLPIYLSGWWGGGILTVTCIGFGQKTYDMFAKIWPAYGIGSMAAFWLVERIRGF